MDELQLSVFISLSLYVCVCVCVIGLGTPMNILSLFFLPVAVHSETSGLVSMATDD